MPLPERALPSGWPRAVRALIGELVASGVEEFEFAGDGIRLRIRRRPGLAALPTPAPKVIPPPRGPTIDAPLAGIFYRAPSPDAEPFVREGDEVVPGQTVGLIEAMKVFNEVQADRSGRVVRFLAANGQLVHLGDPLIELAEAE
jgi:acetyl-CoA carboxylase biotin carboxyl carrier protein